MPPSPAWDRLYETAEQQAGLFALSQAEECGYSSQHLQKHLRAKRIRRVRRGIYRLVQFPASEHEEFVALWLWSKREGVFSHATSLFLQDLSDLLPTSLHMTLPCSWRRRRFMVPPDLTLHFHDLAPDEWTWHECIPITRPARAISECIDAHVSPEHTGQALRQAKERGLISHAEKRALSSQLRAARSERT